MVKKLNYEPVMVVITCLILFFLATLVGINALLYISVPEHIGQSEIFTQFSKRMDAVDAFVVTHIQEKNAQKGKIIHEKLFREIEVLRGMATHYNKMADEHYNKDYFQQCKMAWKDLEMRVVGVEVFSGIKHPQAGKSPFILEENLNDTE